MAAVSDVDRAAIRREAEAEIGAYRQRLDAAQWDAALAAATARLARGLRPAVCRQIAAAFARE